MTERLTKNPVTLADVARTAGVSLSTASRALNGTTRKVRPDLLRRVVDAAAGLHYSANTQAQAMARGRSNAVGLVVSDIADPYFSSIAAGVIKAAEAHGLIVTIACTLHHLERELAYVAALRGQRARAAIFVGSRSADRALLARLGNELAEFQHTGGRVVMVSQQKLPVDTIMIENRAGAKSLGEALADQGYRKFVILAGPRDLLTARDRLAGFQQGLARRGITVPADNIVYGAFTRDGGHRAMSEALANRLDAHCVFAVNDVMAVGAMAALRAAGRRLPTDIAVAGFDDVGLAQDVSPSLTTVRLPLEELGVLALELVLEPRAQRARLRRIGGTVIVRESTPAR